MLFWVVVVLAGLLGRFCSLWRWWCETGGRLGPTACADGGHFVVRFDASDAGSIFGAGSGFGMDLALGADCASSR